MRRLTVIATTLASLGILGCGSGGSSQFGRVRPDASTVGTDGSTGCFTCDIADGGASPWPLGSDGGLILPANFVPTSLGGYALGPSLVDGGTNAAVPVNSGSGCALVAGVVRDFKYETDPGGGDPDFGVFCCGVTTGLVTPTLDANGKPQFAGICNTNNPDISSANICPGGQMLTTQANFEEWYHYTPGINLPYLVYLQFVQNGNVYTFEADGAHEFFPLDGAGWGNNATVNGVPHNFGFTTELHLEFTYRGGETFSFTGDDDVWVFINGKLAVDIGGVHASATNSLSIDSLGLTKGSDYPLDIFNAERHLTNSDFRVDTDLSFSACGTVPTGGAQ